MKQTKMHLNKVLKAMIVTGSITGAMASTITSANANEQPWVTGHGLTQTKIDSSKEAYNTYQSDESLPPVSAYLSNWTHYQQGYQPNIEVLSKYDTVILSFFGLCGTEIGDPAIPNAVQKLKQHCGLFNAEKFEIMTTDYWADLQVGFPSAGISSGSKKWLEPNPSGMLGVMKKLAEETDTKVAVSIFGWSLSNIASDAVKPENRKVFITSLIRFLEAYPFVSQLDIDWEYPGIQGASENVFDPENDARNYAEFISELRSALNNAHREDIKIGIASGAPQDKIDAAELQNLITAGVDTIHLMTYDFFGESWAEGLAHHTNLMSNASRDWSSDASIDYMINELHIDPKRIQIGYANYSRNAINATITSKSPLEGSFTKGKNVMGTFEGASSQINDIFTHYVKPDENNGLVPQNGYHLFTDAEANADYLYNNGNQVFVSFDTPRTVYAKAQYARKHNLGGIFNWMGDPDEGLMLNAAREGLGYSLENQVFDMDKIINTCGENITSQEQCHDLTHLIESDSGHTVHTKDVTTEYQSGRRYQLLATVDDDPEIKSVEWSLETVSGVDAKDVVIAGDQGLSSSFEITAANVVENISANFKVTVTFADDKTSSATMKYKLKVDESIPVITDIAHPDEYIYGSGEVFNFNVIAQDNQSDQLNYQWRVTPSDTVISSGMNESNLLVDIEKLANRPSYDITASVTVTNHFGNTAESSATTKVKGDPTLNQAPIASFDVRPENAQQGDVIEMTSTSKDELVNELQYQWYVTLNGTDITVDQKSGVTASFKSQEAGEYKVHLQVTDVFGITDEYTQDVEVSERLIPEQCDGIDPNADKYSAWVQGRTYWGDDIVSHNSLVYRAKYWTQSEPSVTATEWTLMSDKELPWNADAIYSAGDEVDHNGRHWQAQYYAEKGREPGIAPMWKDVGEAVCP